MENEMKKMIEKKEERNEMKRNEKKTCLVWNEKEGKIEISEFPPFGKFYIVNSLNFRYSELFISDLTEIIKKHSIEELLKSGLLSIFIESDDELVFRNGYIHVKELKEGDIVIKFPLRKTHVEQDIVSTPASYWLAVGEAFVYKGSKSSAPAHSAPAPRPERRGDRQARVMR